MKILIIEDESKAVDYLTKGLLECGYSVDSALNGEAGLHLAKTINFDLLILDVMLPGRNGWAILKSLRESGNQKPVLFLTAKDMVEDRVKGLELGADDYLVKPFAFSELLARIRSILRRGPSLKSEVVRVADLEIDPVRQKAARGGKKLDLTRKEFALLYFLASHSGEVLTRTIIAEQVWDMNFDGDTNIIAVHVARLRSKVDDSFPGKLIHTARGVGYVLEERS
jgi:two-component system copper resistance phosphate regulon response regulator CusR